LSRPVYRVGIVGAGAAARQHLRALGQIKSLQVVSIRDLHEEVAARLAAEFGLPMEVVAQPSGFYKRRPQSVHIVTPPTSHEELAAEALQHDCHVLVEKPPALTLAGCERLLTEAAARRLSISVNENTAHEPLLVRARAIIAAGRLGRVLQIDGHYCYGLGESEHPAPWMDALPGGMLEDLLPHLLTTARALAGCPLVPEHWRLVKTGAIGEQQNDELRLLLAGHDLTVNLTLSLAARPKAFAVVVRGTRATLVADLRNMLLYVSRLPPSGGAVAVGGELVRFGSSVLWQTASNAVAIIAGHREPHGSFLPLIRSYYAALQSGMELPAPLARAAETTAIIERIWPRARATERPRYPKPEQSVHP
jgi:predicted dehydrogenase